MQWSPTMGKDSFALLTGLFMAVLIAVSVIIVIWLGEFDHRSHTYVAVSRGAVTGLKPGSTVYYRGIAIGKVSDVSFDPDDPGLIVVPMAINEGVRLKRGVYATLEMQGVTGLTRIALKNRENMPGGYLPEGDNPGKRIPIEPSLIDRLSESGEDTLVESRELIRRLNRLLDDETIAHAQGTLLNLERASLRFNRLQDHVLTVLDDAPALLADARRALTDVHRLADEYRMLGGQVRDDLQVLSEESVATLATGRQVGRHLLDTTLPKADRLMLRLQDSARRFDRIATILEYDPQSLLLGADPLQPAPGEPGFEEAR
ncbi:MlaD family protein [Methylomarinum sp. Ch1-1]|uniref:MlaD family protein n=1 Tax=Methylomarinum roseum TaxID=3067653 RepID=A0AAU7NS13_9GAMM|nr:MlaD family protein [Methylomarinum sp. Ch1-1]MDP4520643.1 MlaD family protein [Methylomarinum sp. Ch1-1]